MANDMNEIEQIRLAAHALADSLTGELGHRDMDDFGRSLYELAAGKVDDPTALAATFLLGLIAMMTEDDDESRTGQIMIIRQVIIKSTIDKIFLPGGPQNFGQRN